MAERLDEIEASLQDLFDSLPDDEKTSFATGQITTSLGEWAGVVQDHIGWRNEKSHHGTGSALDINVNQSPYIVTRTGVVLGGEAVKFEGREAMRLLAVSVYDRAAAFRLQGFLANVSDRQPNETHGEVYDRFEAVSTALRQYLGLAFKTDGPLIIQRPPIENAGIATLDNLLAIPESERKPQDQAILSISAMLQDPDFIATHPSFPFTVEETYQQILRDYELVRIPMVIGTPSLEPQKSRNPVYGFINLRREVIVAMCDEGSNQLRWGTCDFGPEQDGDTGHFDLGVNDPHPELL
jgi:hypothetical protein